MHYMTHIKSKCVCACKSGYENEVVTGRFAIELACQKWVPTHRHIHKLHSIREHIKQKIQCMWKNERAKKRKKMRE